MTDVARVQDDSEGVEELPATEMPILPKEEAAVQQPAIEVDPKAERCPACPLAGAPIPPTTSTGPLVDSLVWIACHKCATWYHTFCVITSRTTPEGSKMSLNETIPELVKTESASHEEGDWWNWSSQIDRWYCAPCIEYSTSPENPRKPHHPLVTTVKALAKRKAAASGSVEASNKRPKRQAAQNAPDYRAMHVGDATPTAMWLKLISNPEDSKRKISDRPYTHIKGRDLTKQWIESAESNSLFFGPNREPIIVKKEDGGFSSMGGHIPGPGFSVTDVAQQVGPERPVNVIDVATQLSTQWTLEKWAEYVESSASGDGADDDGALGQARGKVYNVISLEISGTDLAKRVKPPAIVREIDWVDNFWDFGTTGKTDDTYESPKEAGQKPKRVTQWPKVQLYCLMGMRGSWTDWHIDFAASSVYYTVHTGAKTFFFIRPTPSNLANYRKWSGSAELQQTQWLGDSCDEVRKVTLHAGDTMIIPSGYIHAVYTPEDSIVFGGNFLHSYDIDSQLKVREIEIETKVPQMFRYPLFEKLAWYVAERYTSELRKLRQYKPSKGIGAKCPLHPRVLDGLSLLADFLVSQADVLEDPGVDDKKRKLVFDKIPTDKVPDPAGLSRELKWRVDKERGVPSTTGTVATGEGNKQNGTAQVKKAKPFEPLDRLSRSRTYDFTSEPWESTSSPRRTISEEIVMERPDVSGATPVGASDSALRTITEESQSRTRTRTEGDEVLKEDQRVTFTTTTIQWGAKAKVED